nr:hypothetical protein [Corynebacterium lactis]
MGKANSKKKLDKKAEKLLRLASAKPKAKCCRSRTRCMKCPVVIHKLQREINAGNVNRDHLLKVVAKARKR